MKVYVFKHYKTTGITILIEANTKNDALLILEKLLSNMYAQFNLVSGE